MAGPALDGYFVYPDVYSRTCDDEKEQRQVILLSGIMFLAAFIMAGLNYRFEWIVLPAWVSYAAAIVFIAVYVLYAEVLQENVYKTCDTVFRDLSQIDVQEWISMIAGQNETADRFSFTYIANER